MTATQIIKTNLRLALNYQIKLSREELVEQGHYASGRLDRSFEARVVMNAVDGLVGQILTEDYGEALDTGVRAENIRYNPAVLLPWLRIVKKNLNDTARLRLAYAIKSTHTKEGMPSRGALAYSNNGRRTGWKAASIAAASDRIDEILGVQDYVEALIDEAFGKLVKG